MVSVIKALWYLIFIITNSFLFYCLCVQGGRVAVWGQLWVCHGGCSGGCQGSQSGSEMCGWVADLYMMCQWCWYCIGRAFNCDARFKLTWLYTSSFQWGAERVWDREKYDAGVSLPLLSLPLIIFKPMTPPILLPTTFFFLHGQIALCYWMHRFSRSYPF